ncbi:MAG: hypothetical protein LC647_05405 [Beggiatoa sp.]|nr:hypothetical protein [Beggiatoa sp.]
MVAVKLNDLAMAFEFVGAAPPCENNAYISLDTGEIFWTSKMNRMDEDVPDDLETSDRYLPIPHKTDLDLGKRLALRFVASELPRCYDQAAGFFRRAGAYARFKALLDSKGTLERWHAYEAESIEQALRAWCAENELELNEGPRSLG